LIPRPSDGKSTIKIEKEHFIDMKKLVVEGVREETLEKCISKMDEVIKWSNDQKMDRWALRAALLKALYDNADEYFESGEGTFREIAAFDNGVATALKKLKG
jgi:hypothetical protein